MTSFKTVGVKESHEVGPLCILTPIGWSRPRRKLAASGMKLFPEDMLCTCYHSALWVLSIGFLVITFAAVSCIPMNFIQHYDLRDLDMIPLVSKIVVFRRIEEISEGLNELSPICKF